MAQRSARAAPIFAPQSSYFAAQNELNKMSR
jgi:hypothetical protein